MSVLSCLPVFPVDSNVLNDLHSREDNYRTWSLAHSHGYGDCGKGEKKVYCVETSVRGIEERRVTGSEYSPSFINVSVGERMGRPQMSSDTC